MNRLTRDQRQLLNPYAEIYARLRERIERLPDQELTALADAAAVPTQTNCWFAIYHVAQMIRPLATSELLRRQRAAQGIEARSGETLLSGSTEGESPVRKADAP